MIPPIILAESAFLNGWNGATMELIQTRERFTCNDGFSMGAYISRPKTSARVPGILFIYEAFGMSEEMIRIADELAAEGFAVLLPDLLTRGSWFSCVRQVMKDIKAGSGRGVQDLIQARSWLSQQDYVEPGRIAV